MKLVLSQPLCGYKVSPRKKTKKNDYQRTIQAQIAKKIDPIQIGPAKIAPKQHQYAAKITDGIGHINQKADVAAFAKGGQQPVEDDPVEQNIR